MRYKKPLIIEALLRAAWAADDFKCYSAAKQYRQQAACTLEIELENIKDSPQKAQQLFRITEIYRRSGEFQMAYDTLGKVDVKKLHPDLCIMMPKLQQMTLDGMNRKVLIG